MATTITTIEPFVRRTFFQRGGGWVIVQFLLMSAVAILAWWLPGTGVGTGAGWLGWLLLALGGVVGLAGVVALGRGTTPLPKPGEHACLVQTGIYARIRHPLYTSVMLMALGWALIWQSWPSLAAALTLFPFFHTKARCEERWLRERFDAYAEYEARVPRFFPRLGRSRTSE